MTGCRASQGDRLCIMRISHPVCDTGVCLIPAGCASMGEIYSHSERKSRGFLPRSLPDFGSLPPSRLGVPPSIKSSDFGSLPPSRLWVPPSITTLGPSLHHDFGSLPPSSHQTLGLSLHQDFWSLPPSRHFQTSLSLPLHPSLPPPFNPCFMSPLLSSLTCLVSTKPSWCLQPPPPLKNSAPCPTTRQNHESHPSCIMSACTLAILCCSASPSSSRGAGLPGEREGERE
jgi:hypothetical protein